MKCPMCGALANDDSTKCAACGESLKPSARTKVQDIPPWALLLVVAFYYLVVQPPLQQGMGINVARITGFAILGAAVVYYSFLFVRRLFGIKPAGSNPDDPADTD